MNDEVIIVTGFDVRSGNLILNYVGCGEVFDVDSPSIDGLRICGENGYCENCSQASSKANSEDQE